MDIQEAPTLERLCTADTPTDVSALMSPTSLAKSPVVVHCCCSSGSCVVSLDQVKSALLPPKSPLAANNQQQSAQHYPRPHGRPLTSSPLKNHKANVASNHHTSNNNENGRVASQYHRSQSSTKHYRHFSQQTGTGKNGGVYRRNNSLLSKLHVFHSKQQQQHNCDSTAKLSSQQQHEHNSSISKSTCDTINNNNKQPQQPNGTTAGPATLNKRYPPHLNGNSGSASHKKNSKVDALSYANKNYKRAISFDESNGGSRPKKTRRSRKRSHKKRPLEVSPAEAAGRAANKRMRWTECNADEVSRLHRNCMQKGQPLAPYNTTQFIMNEHNAEKAIDFDELSGQIQQLHNSRKQSSATVAPVVVDQNSTTNTSTSEENKTLGTTMTSGPCSDHDDSVNDDYYYSSPEDESYYLEQQFHEAYDTMHQERLNSMSKDDLLKEYLKIEKELETMQQKSPGGGQSSEGGKSLMVGGGGLGSKSPRSPRPPSKPSSPRQQALSVQQSSRLAPHAAHHHTHGGTCTCTASHQHRNLFKENKHLRKLLKQVYSRYNSLLYCINYVNNSSETGSTNTNLDESGSSIATTNATTTAANNAINGLQDTADFQLTNEMHYRIEKLIATAHQGHHQHPAHSSDSDSSGSSSSYTGSSTSTSSSDGSSPVSTTTISSEEDDHHQADRPPARIIPELHYELFDDDDALLQDDADADEEVAGLLQEVINLVAEGN